MQIIKNWHTSNIPPLGGLGGLRVVFLFLIAITTLCSCTDDEKESIYQTLTAEMADVHTDSQSRITHAITDDGKDLSFTYQPKVAFINRPDTVYRTLLYYTTESDDKNVVRPVSFVQTLTLEPKTKKEAEKWYDEQDPVTLVSQWRTNRYLNLHITILTGAAEDRTQTFGVVDEGTIDGTHHLRLCHNQNKVPRAYSSDVYLCIPIHDIPSSEPIDISIPK